MLLFFLFLFLFIYNITSSPLMPLSSSHTFKAAFQPRRVEQQSSNYGSLLSDDAADATDTICEYVQPIGSIALFRQDAGNIAVGIIHTGLPSTSSSDTVADAEADADADAAAGACALCQSTSKIASDIAQQSEGDRKCSKTQNHINK